MPDPSLESDNGHLTAYPDAAPPPPEEQAVPETMAVPEPEISSSSLMERAQAAGVDTSQYGTDKELADAMFSSLEQAGPYVKYAQQMMPHHNQFQQYMSGQQAPAQQAPVQQAPPPPEPEPEPEFSTESHFADKWVKPDYSDSWDQYITSGMVRLDPSTGQYINGTDPNGSPLFPPSNVVEGLNAHRTWQRESIDKLLDNPYQMTWDAIQEPMSRAIESKVQELIGGYDSRQQLTQFESQYAPLIYQQDNNQQYIPDTSGGYHLTPIGNKFYQEVETLKNAGVQDPSFIAQKAMDYATVGLQQQMQQQQMQQQQMQQPQQPQPAQADPRESFVSQALQRAAAVPSQGGYSQSPLESSPAVPTRAELENFFVNRFRESAS